MIKTLHCSWFPTWKSYRNVCACRGSILTRREVEVWITHIPNDTWAGVGEKRQHIKLIKKEGNKSTDFLYLPGGVCAVITMTAFRWNAEGTISSERSLQSVLFIYGYDTLMLSPDTCAIYVNVLEPKLSSSLMDLERWELWIQRLRLRLSL